MLKKEGKNRVSLSLKCGDCLHYKQVAKFETVCALQGIHEKASAPDCFSPDIYKMVDKTHPEILFELGKLVKDFGPSKLRILAYTFKTASIIAKHGYQFGQPVYFSLGEDYLTHYFMGYVVGATSEHVYVAARLNKCKTNTMAMFLPSALLSKPEFKKKAIELQIAKRITLPKLKHNKDKCYPAPEYLNSKGMLPDFKSEKFDYEPPTIDTAPPEWLDAQNKKTEKDRNKKGPKARQKLIKMVDVEKVKKKKSKPQALIME